MEAEERVFYGRQESRSSNTKLAERRPRRLSPLQLARNESIPSLLETSMISISTLAWGKTSKDSWVVSILRTASRQPRKPRQDRQSQLKGRLRNLDLQSHQRKLLSWDSRNRCPKRERYIDGLYKQRILQSSIKLG